MAVAGPVVVGAAAFAVVVMTAVVGGDPGDRFALAMTWSARNLGIGTLVGVTILGQAEWPVFTAAFFAAGARRPRVDRPVRRGAPAV